MRVKLSWLTFLYACWVVQMCWCIQPEFKLTSINTCWIHRSITHVLVQITRSYKSIPLPEAAHTGEDEDRPCHTPPAPGGRSREVQERAASYGEGNSASWGGTSPVERTVGDEGNRWRMCMCCVCRKLEEVFLALHLYARFGRESCSEERPNRL